MSRSLPVVITIFIICLALACLGGLIWVNSQYVRSHPVEKDFLVPWLGARTFLQYGDSPYSDPATQRAQILYYGRLAGQGQDPLVLWLPFPVELLYFPIALIPDYVLARATWMTCIEIALAALAFLSLELTGWKPKWVLLPLIFLTPILWIYGVLSLVSANAAGFIALGLAGFLLAVRNEQDELAGGLLVLLVSAIRITGVFALFMFWWIFYQRRWRIIWGFLMTFGVLLGLAFLFLPGWFMPFLRGLILHYSFNQGLSSTAIFATWSPVVGLRLGWVLTAILTLLLLLEWGTNLKKDFRTFLWVSCLTLAVTPLMGIPMIPEEYIFLFIPLTLFLSILAERRSWLKDWGVGTILLLVVLGGIWLLAKFPLLGNNSASLSDVLILLLPTLLAIILYWIRWRFVHAVRPELEVHP